MYATWWKTVRGTKEGGKDTIRRAQSIHIPRESINTQHPKTGWATTSNQSWWLSTHCTSKGACSTRGSKHLLPLTCQILCISLQLYNKTNSRGLIPDDTWSSIPMIFLGQVQVFLQVKDTMRCTSFPYSQSTGATKSTAVLIYQVLENEGSSICCLCKGGAFLDPWKRGGTSSEVEALWRQSFLTHCKSSDPVLVTSYLFIKGTCKGEVLMWETDLQLAFTVFYKIPATPLKGTEGQCFCSNELENPPKLSKKMT